MVDCLILFFVFMVCVFIVGQKMQMWWIIKLQLLVDVVCYCWFDVLIYGFIVEEVLIMNWYIVKLKVLIGDWFWVWESVIWFDKGICDQYVWYCVGSNIEEFY